MMLNRKLLLSTLSALALISGCGGNGSDSGSNGGPAPAGTDSSSANPVQQGAEKLNVSIKSFDSQQPCNELTEYLASYGETVMQQRLLAIRDSQYDYSPFPGRPLPLGETINQTQTPGAAVSTPTAASPGSTSANSSATPGSTGAADSGTTPSNRSFTTTNIQTAGIDEPDVVKNNDRHVFRLHHENDRTVLTKARYWPANDLSLVGKQLVPLHVTPSGSRQYAWTRGMFVTESETAVVLSTLDGGSLLLDPLATGVASTAIGATSTPALGVDMICPMSGCYFGPRVQKSYIDLFDASAAAAPAFQSTIEIGGSLIDARRRGDRLWVLTQQEFKFPESVSWTPKDFNYSAPAAARKAAYDQLIEQNRALIRAADFRQWVPEDLAQAAAVSAEAASQVCRSVKKVSEASELNWLRVASVKLSDRSVSSELILAEGQTVYASNRAIYISTPNWRAVANVDPGPRTYVHKFLIADEGVARYAASGAFAGQPLNSYSFDEDENGTLRFAANALRVGAIDSTSIQSWEPYSYLGLMKQDGARLVVAAHSGRIAPGERMQSVRFVGPRAYLVTFRQVDPFYVYDMNASQGPLALGELKIPGFSTYLHPLGDRHIIGIGYADGGWPRRIKASLFDVSDPANPREQSNLILGDVYSASEALWDPHAFSYLPRTANAGTLAVPVWSYNYNPAVQQHSGLKILNVSAEQGLSLVGELAVDDLLQSSSSAIDNYALQIRRSILTEGFVFAVGHQVLRSATLANPALPIATLLTR